MNEADQIRFLQSLLDQYRTKFYQAEYDYTLFQIQAKATIQSLEDQVRQLSAREEGNE